MLRRFRGARSEHTDRYVSDEQRRNRPTAGRRIVPLILSRALRVEAIDIMKPLLMIVCLAAFTVASDSSGPDEKTRIQMVEYMLKTPTGEADPVLVSGFMSLDATALPKKLRDKARGKQMEIGALVKINKGKKRGPLRIIAPGCEVKRYGPEGVRVMQLIQDNSEIAIEEEEYIEKRGQCTEDQLICEFTLNVVVIPQPGKKPIKRYWLMEKDPMMAWIGEFRARGAVTSTNYFQELKPRCSK